MAAEHFRQDGGEGVGIFFKGNRHDHNLQMYEGLKPYTCTGCREMGVNLGWECSDPSSHPGEKIIFHFDCVTLGDDEKHPIRKDLKFRFRPKTSFLPHRCTACANKLEGFVYEAKDPFLKNKGKDPVMRLHPLCLMLPHEFVYEGHSFRLTMDKVNPYNIHELGWKYMCGDVMCRDVCMAVGCVKNRLYELSEIGMQSSPVRRRRDHLKDVAKRVARYVVPAAGVAGGVAGVVNCFLG